MGKRMREQQGLTPTPHANGGIAIERGAHTDPPREDDTGQPDRILNNLTLPYPPAPDNQSPPLHPPGACTPDTLESRRTKRGAQGYGERNEGECGVPSTGLHTEPEPSTARAPEGECEAT